MLKMFKRHQLERLPRQRVEPTRTSQTPSQSSSQGTNSATYAAVAQGGQGNAAAKKTPPPEARYLLPQLMEEHRQAMQGDDADDPDRRLFLQDMILSSLLRDVTLQDKPRSAGGRSHPRGLTLGAATGQLDIGGNRSTNCNPTTLNLHPPPPQEGVHGRGAWLEGSVQKNRAHRNGDGQERTVLH